MGAAAVGLSFVVAVALFLSLAPCRLRSAWSQSRSGQWIEIGQFRPEIALLIDPLSTLMILVVTGVGFLIHVYSMAYMKLDDEHHDLDVRRYVRYFVYVNFFIVAMLVLVLGNNLLMLYMGWEGVGLASYLLIGFWFHKPSARDAGKKAFIVNRVGDFGMALAIMLIFRQLAMTRRGRAAPAAWPSPISSRSSRPTRPRCWASLWPRRCSCCWPPPASRPRSRSGSGCPTPWKAPPRSAP